MTVKGELKRLADLECRFYRVAFINSDKVLAVYEGSSVPELHSGKAFASQLKFEKQYIMGSTILFFLNKKEASLCPRGKYLK